MPGELVERWADADVGAGDLTEHTDQVVLDGGTAQMHDAHLQVGKQSPRGSDVAGIELVGDLGQAAASNSRNLCCDNNIRPREGQPENVGRLPKIVRVGDLPEQDRFDQRGSSRMARR